MTDESALGEESFRIQGSGGLIWNNTIALTPERIQIIKHSGKIEASCSITEAKLVSCEYWELRVAGAVPRHNSIRR